MIDPYESPKTMADFLLGTRGRPIKRTLEYLTSAISTYESAGMVDTAKFWRETKEEVEREQARREREGQSE